MSIHRLIVPFGIATYTSLLLTVLSGVFIFKMHFRWLKLKTHIFLGILTFILGTLHACLVIFFD
ncbi:MAG: hypothetical protein JW994_05340 [Candidatus Omnitrophica bacterium]|nr:hypothetical protein [Candidatus Omnitrophota bacterium]